MMDKQPSVLSDAGTFSTLVSTSGTLQDQRQADLETLTKKAHHLRYTLEKDFKACDIKWSLFVAAAFNFRYESCLRPFPPAFMKNGIKNMDELLTVIADVPALDLVLQQLINQEDLCKISDVIHLLFFILVRLKEPILTTIPSESHDPILHYVYSQTLESAPKPQYIFQVLSSPKSIAEQKWKDLARNHRIFYAYHGNQLENFYSMLCFNVMQRINKQNAPTGGVHLTADLSVGLSRSRGGFGWGASCIGGHLSCVALCEVIDSPEGINYQRASEGYSGDNARCEQLMIESETSGTESHYIVSNSDLVRVRYIFVYAKQPTSMRFPSASNRNDNGLRQWVASHKLFSILLGYGLMLATIGFANNQPLHQYYELLLNKLDIAYTSVKL